MRLQTRMCGLNVYINLRVDDISWCSSWMNKNRNLGLCQKFFFIPFTYFYLFKTLNTQNNIVSNSISNWKGFLPAV